MKQNHIVAAIDIGSAHIIAALATITPAGDIIPIALTETPSRGIKKGGIVNIALAQHAIDTVLDQLQTDGNYHIHSVITSLSGVGIMGHNATGSIEIKGNPVSHHNMMQAIAAAKEVAMMDDRQLLHILHQYFVVDRQTGIDNPIGLLGEKLSVSVHVISVAKTAYYNLLHVFSHRDVDVEYIIASGFASALAATTPDEKQLGICVLDIGAGTTDITVIHNGIVKHSEVIQLGGELKTSDIAFYMRTTVDSAEAVKKSIDISKNEDSDTTITVKGLSETQRHFHHQDIVKIIEERCDQLLDLVVQKLKRAGVEDYFPGGFVICGGAANLKGIEHLIMSKTQLPARIGKIEVSLSDKTLKDSRYATIMGLFLCAYEEDYTRSMANTRKKGIIKRLNEKIMSGFLRLKKQF